MRSILGLEPVLAQTESDSRSRTLLALASRRHFQTAGLQRKFDDGNVVRLTRPMGTFLAQVTCRQFQSGKRPERGVATCNDDLWNKE